jgi:uncharacterized membrane protein YvlD (DUF360 family)
VTVLTLGLGVVVLNGVIVLLVSLIEPGLEVSSLAAGIPARRWRRSAHG